MQVNTRGKELIKLIKPESTRARTRVFSFFLAVMMTLSVFLQFPLVAEAGVTAGAGGSLSDRGTRIGNKGGVSHIDLAIFRVGITDHPSFYNDRDPRTMNNMREVWRYSYLENEESVFFMPPGVENTYYTGIKYYVGKYNAANKDVDLYDDPQNLARVIFLPNPPSSAPTLVAKSRILDKIESNKLDELKDGGWQTALGLNLESVSVKNNTLSAWSWAFKKDSYEAGNTYDPSRISDIISPYAREFTAPDSLPEVEMQDIKAGFLALLVQTWALMPPDIKPTWELGIERYISGEGQIMGYNKEKFNGYDPNIIPIPEPPEPEADPEFFNDAKPTTIYIDTAMALSFTGTGKVERVILPTIDYFENYTKIASEKNRLYHYRDPSATDTKKLKELENNNVTDPNRRMIGRDDRYTEPFNTYDLLYTLVVRDLKDNPNIPRFSTETDWDNAFTFGSSAIVYPNSRFTTQGKKPHWRASSVETAALDLLNVGSFTRLQKGFAYVNFSPASTPTINTPEGKLNVLFKVEPTEKQLQPNEEIIGTNVTLSFTHDGTDKETYAVWQAIFAGDPELKEVTVRITPNRSTPKATIPASYTSGEGDYTVGVNISTEDFLAWVSGQGTLRIVDNTSSQPIKEREEIVYTYKPKFEVIYTVKGEEKVVVYDKLEGSAKFTRPPNPPELISYTSEPSAYAEFKNGTPDNEEFEAMAGVPSNRRLYLGVGGSEFIVDIELEYKQNVDSVWRTYRSYFTGTASEFKQGDTAGSKSLGGHTVDTYNGGTYTKTWTGTIPNLAEPVTRTGRGDVVAVSTAKPDRKEYNKAKQEALDYIKEVNSTVLKHKAASDQETREYNNWNARITVDNPIDPETTTAESSCWTTQGDPPVPVGCETSATAQPGPDGSFTITVTFDVPPHIIDGPESTNDMPGVEDTWKQRVNFDYMKISRVEVYKIEEGRIVNVEGVFGSNNELKALIQRGEPNIFYNIAQRNAGGDDEAAQSSLHGRLRYTLEPNQHDTVVWYEGVRTNKSDGMGAHGQTLTGAPQGGGHSNWWAKGILYTNNHYWAKTAEELETSEVKTDYSPYADSVDRETTEYKKFLQRRESKNKVSIISDMLILQTSSGDQAVLYFHKDSEEVQAQEQFPDVRVTKEEMWDNNPLSAANWETNQIYVGSYNGKFEFTGNGSTNNRKYWGLDQTTGTLLNNAPTGERAISTKFDEIPAGKSRPSRPSKLYIYGTRDIIPTTPNGPYTNSGAEVFYERILSWKTPNPYSEYPGMQLQPNAYTPKAQPGFGNKQGLVFDAPYSDAHDKVNDIVIHTPVTAERAMIVALPAERDQRVELPPGGAAALIEEQNMKPPTQNIPDVELVNIDFENYTSSTILNKTTGKYIPYTTSSGITIGKQSGFGSGNVLKAFGTRWSLDFKDIGLEYSDDSTVYVELDLWIPAGQTGSSMIVSFHRYDFYLPSVATGVPTWNTGNGWERRADGVNLYDKKVKLGLEFSFSDVNKNRLFIDGVEHKAYTRVNDSNPITSASVGNKLHIGSWGTNETYPAKFYVDNLRVVLKGIYPGVNFKPHSTKLIETTAETKKTTTISTTVTETIRSPDVTGSKTFNYTGSVQTFTAPEDGTYTLEVWGAEGGTSGYGGKGGYAKGTIELKKGQVLKVYVGGQTGWNGGGSGHGRDTDSGGGATDIRLGGTKTTKVIREWDFRNNQTHGFYGGTASISGHSSGLRVNVGGEDTYFYTPSNLNLAVTGHEKIQIKVKNEAGGTGGTIFFTNEKYTNDNAATQKYFTMSAKDTSFKTYTIDMSTQPEWKGIINRIRFDLADGSNWTSGYAYVESIKIILEEEERIIVAGGGGGWGGTASARGGDGGGTVGGDGGKRYGNPGTGGTQTSGGKGGSNNGRDGSFGLGGSNITGSNSGGGGGGGGYYGGGAGGNDNPNYDDRDDSGGGGGSGYIGGVKNGTMESGVNSGNGKAVISYTIKGKSESKSTTTSTSKVDGPTVRKSTNTMVVQGDDGYKGYTWAQLMGSNWRDYFVTTTETKTTVVPNTSTETKTDDLSSLVGKPHNFTYTGAMQRFTAPVTGTYELEVWGAEGGSYLDGIGGKGGYSRGKVKLNKGETIYVYVGGSGQSGGWNGGSSGGSVKGGGATDIRRVGTVDPLSLSSLNSRIIVAGGGGGAERTQGGYGGGNEGGSGSSYGGVTIPTGGTQSAGGKAGSHTNFGTGGAGSFGVGGDGLAKPKQGYSADSGPSGGGGWYGGGGVTYAGGAGGGSGYIGGVTDGETIAGNKTMPNPNGGTMVGKSGHGYARITLVPETGSSGSGGEPMEEPVNFTYTGSVQTWTVPSSGRYKLEVWGAEGGNGYNQGPAGKGGYSVGEIDLKVGDKLHVYVGGQGGTYLNENKGGWNGGGNGNGNSGAWGGGGGGATDIRTGTDLNSRIIVAGGGGGGGHRGMSGDSGGAGGGLEGVQGGAGRPAGTQTSGYALGVGQSSTGHDMGAGGGGYYGGYASTTSDRGGSGGSGYIGGVENGQSIAGNQSIPNPSGGTMIGRSGDGYARITQLEAVPDTEVSIKETTTVKLETKVTTKTTEFFEALNEPKVIQDLDKFPDWMPDGNYNPLKIAFGYPDPSPPSPITTPVPTPEGDSLRLATFINIDYGFRIYFPNLGDFAQQPTLQGIPYTTQARGKGYYNNMDTTQYTAKKRVRMPFNVIFNNQLYTANTWIELPVNQSYYDFYLVLANKEASAAKIEYDVAPINGRPIGNPFSDNYVTVNNKERFTNLKSYHGGYKKSYVDVVGRIGNFVAMDTDDFRMSNLFKQPSGSGNWVVEGIVREVDPYAQNQYYGDLVDIRGLSIGTSTKYLNTWGTQDWLEQQPLRFPINANDNTQEPLKEEFLKPGYNILADISTIGNYQTGVVRAIPYYYKLDLDTGKIIPLDVYTRNGQTYQIVNKYRGADGGVLPEDLYEHDMIINWENEAGRRNYTPDEAFVTERVSDSNVEYIYGTVYSDDDGEGEGVVGEVPLPIPMGSYIDVGNSQRVVVTSEARTFIGTSKTYGNEMNKGGRLADNLWDSAAQRWHMKFGLPSSSHFVEAGKPPTEANLEAIRSGNGVVLLAVDIISIGELYTLRWDQPGISTVTVRREGVTRTFNIGSVGIPPVIALYDLDTTSKIDVTSKGSH